VLLEQIEPRGQVQDPKIPQNEEEEKIGVQTPLTPLLLEVTVAEEISQRALSEHITVKSCAKEGLPTPAT